MENKTKVGAILLSALGVELNGQAMVDIEGKKSFEAIKDTLQYNCNYGAENASVKAYSDMTQEAWDNWDGAFTTTSSTIGSVMDYINSMPTVPQDVEIEKLVSTNDIIYTMSDDVFLKPITKKYFLRNLTDDSFKLIELNNTVDFMALESNKDYYFDLTIQSVDWFTGLKYSFKFSDNTTYSRYGVVQAFNRHSVHFGNTGSILYELVNTSIPYDDTYKSGASTEKGEERIPVGSVVIPGTITVPSDRPLTWEDIIAGGIVIIPGKPPVGPDVQPPVWCNTNKELLLWSIGQKIRGNNPILPPGMIPTGDTETTLHELMEVTNG